MKSEYKQKCKEYHDIIMKMNKISGEEYRKIIELD